MAKKCVKVAASGRAKAHVRCYGESAKADKAAEEKKGKASGGGGGYDGGPEFTANYENAVKNGYLPSGLSHQQVLESSGYHPDFGDITKVSSSFDSKDGLKIRYETNDMVMQTMHRKDHVYWDLMYAKEGTAWTDKGRGRKALQNVIDNGQKNGKKRIDIYAAAELDGKPANGFYTWPRYGFVSKDPDTIKKYNSYSSNPAIKGKGDLNDIMKTKEGRAAWQREGSGLKWGFDSAFNMTFDLSKSSKNLKFFNENP